MPDLPARTAGTDPATGPNATGRYGFGKDGGVAVRNSNGTHGRLIDDLRGVVGPTHVLTEPDLRAGYERDWTGRFGGPALAVVRPADTEEVAAAIQLCAGAGVAVLTQGGNTGLVGGGVPCPAGPAPILLVTSRLDRMDPIDVAAGQVTVGAGVTLARLHAAAAAVD